MAALFSVHGRTALEHKGHSVHSFSFNSMKGQETWGIRKGTSSPAILNGCWKPINAYYLLFGRIKWGYIEAESKGVVIFLTTLPAKFKYHSFWESGNIPNVLVPQLKCLKRSE